jgi:hypothetical protein
MLVRRGSPPSRRSCSYADLMPESKGRKPAKKTPAQKRASKKAQPRKSPVPQEGSLKVPPWKPRAGDTRSLEFHKPSRDPVRELADDEKFQMPDLPDPASYAQVLVALSKLDPLEQEVLIAQGIAAMPSQKDGSMPVNIHRHVRPPWARQLRKLGFFCIPELATHELVADPGGGVMANHTAARLRKLSTEDFWDMAKQQSPELGRLVDEADTPEKKREAMLTLAKSLPVEIRIAFDRLLAHNPDDLAPR